MPGVTTEATTSSANLSASASASRHWAIVQSIGTLKVMRVASALRLHST